MPTRFVTPALLAAVCLGCQGTPPSQEEETAPVSDVAARVAQYTVVRLAPDLSGLGDAERRMVPLLVEAAQAMDRSFWKQAYGDPEPLMHSLEDPALRRYAEINYGPWDRLEEDAPFVPGTPPKPKGARFYPEDMSREELETAAKGNPELTSLYTVVRRGDDGALTAIPYSEAYAEDYRLASERLREAAELAPTPDLKRYLETRADALLSDDYRESDLAWMEMKDNTLDVVIGPIETYEDQLFGYKASSSAYVLMKDLEWSARLDRYAAFLPDLQRGLPVSDAYKQESPGSDADLGAYDTLYAAGDANAAVKALAFNLPNDEQVQLQKGTRRVQLKSTMRAKFEKILVPIAGVLIEEGQRSHVTFDAFFANGMFHEVAHGLGIKNTLDGSGTVREALKDHYSALEEGKADVLGLYMERALHDRGELGDADLQDNYVTFLASIFRSIRFGATSAHGVANLIRFNFFEEQGAFSRSDGGRYSVDPEAFAEAVTALAERLLVLQGDGDYAAVATFVERYGKASPTLEADLARLAEASIPVDIVYEQGLDVLGL